MDLNGDEYLDIITGQYHPGDITWFRGSEDGFLPGIHLEQEGDPASNGNPDYGSYDGEAGDIGTFSYWNYSTASFGDFDGDGDQDLVVGGFQSIRFSENIGTPTEPKFAQRELLLDVNGEPLRTMTPNAQTSERYRTTGQSGPYTIKASPFVVDWDNDGTLDLLVSDSYTSDEHMAVTFFRGIASEDEFRFEPGVDLLRTNDGAKALPGSCHRLFVADWNNDGVKDLIIGGSVATVNGGEFSDELSWEWENVTEIQSAGKDAGRNEPQPRPTMELFRERFGERMSDDELESMLEMNIKYWDDTIGRLYDEGKEHYLTVRHQGRVYVMLGQPNDEASTDASTTVQAGDNVSRNAQQPQRPLPVNVSFEDSLEAVAGEAVEIKVTFDVIDEWYIYAPTGTNVRQGMSETIVSFELPDGIELDGDVQYPLPLPYESFEILKGQGIEFVQSIKIGTNTSPGDYVVDGEISFQTCNEEVCFPPRTMPFSITVQVSGAE